MERREKQRFAANQEAMIQVLGAGGLRLPATLVDLSGGGMQFTVRREVSAGSPIKMEFGETMVLGEVVYCQATGTQVFTLGVKADQVLAPMADLARLQEALQSDDSAGKHAGVERAKR